MALVQPEFLQTKTYTALRDRLAFEHGGSLQPGVWDANDFKVVQRAAGADRSVDVGAGFAVVDANNAGNAGLYHIENNATTNVPIPAAHATLPRVDQILIDVSDSTSGGDAGDTPGFTVLAGTATSGATLANRTGANPTLPSNTLRVADVLVGAAVTSITNTNIMDRRPWARGAKIRNLGSAGIAGTVGFTQYGGVQRIECSGADLTIVAVCSAISGAGARNWATQLTMDGATVSTKTIWLGSSGAAHETTQTWELQPNAGSHVFALFGSMGAADGSMSAIASGFEWAGRSAANNGTS